MVAVANADPIGLGGYGGLDGGIGLGGLGLGGIGLKPIGIAKTEVVDLYVSKRKGSLAYLN